jgi:Raf kinase inhibitor-like YbhB/YbcL family protein
MSIGVENVKRFLRNSRAWEKGEKNSRVPPAVRRNLKESFPVSLQRDRSRHPPAGQLGGLRGLREADESPAVRRHCLLIEMRDVPCSKQERRIEMKRLALIMIVLGALGIGSVYAENFTLKSDNLGGQLTETQVFSGFGCNGKNISPHLKWMDAPKTTKSFAVTVYDPDAPTGSGWWHWVLFNISSDINELQEDAGNLKRNLSPKGSIQSVTDFGGAGFGGACPPAGDKPHRYIFTVYALNVAKLDLDEKTQPAMVGFFLNQHAVAKASLITYYGR